MEQSRLVLGAPLLDWILHLEAEGFPLNTRKSYRAAGRKYLEFLSVHGFKYDEVTPSVLDRWRIHLVKGLRLKPRTANGHISALRNFYRWAKWNGYIHENLLRELRMIRAERLLPKPYTEEEIGRMLEAAKDPLDRVLIEVYYSTGGRASEIRSANLGDLDLNRRTVLVMGKGLKQAYLPLGKKAVEAVESYLEARRRQGRPMGPEAPLLMGSKSGRLMLRHIRRRVKRVGEAAGVLGEITLHRFRHSFATHMLDRGADLRAIQEMLRHENIQTTQIYTKVSPARMLRTFDDFHPRS